MVRFVNQMSDRLLSLFVPRATASAADCGYPMRRKRCVRGVEWWCNCWTNSNCACGTCDPTTHMC
jgi:hypothetical protein